MKVTKKTKVKKRKKRPIEVTVIGWIFIGVAIFTCLSSMIALIYFSFFYQMIVRNLLQFPGQLKSFLVLFKYGELMMLPTMVVAIFVIIAGIYFLKLRTWARNALEVVSWVAIGYRVGHSIFFMIFWKNIVSHLPIPQGGPTIQLMIGPYGVFLTIFSIMMHIVPLAVIIYFLRGKTVRQAFEKSKN